MSALKAPTFVSNGAQADLRFSNGSTAAAAGLRAQKPAHASISCILERNDLSWDDRRKLASSLNCFANFAGRPLEIVPPQVPVVRGLFGELSAPRFGCRESYFTNMKCQVWKAMRLQGIPVLSGRCKTELPPSWSALVDCLPPGPRRPLLPFIRFCIEGGLEPDQVQQTTFEEFEATLEQYSTRANGGRNF